MTEPKLPYRFFDVRVLRTERIGTALIRVTLGGDGLGDLVTDGRDQRFKLFLPQPGQDAPLLPEPLDEGWYARWRAQDPAERAVMRTYTFRTLHRLPDGTTELDVDFVQHGDTAHSGPASLWSRTARPGDRAAILAPVVENNGGADYQPPAGTDWTLITADESALPAVAGILAWLPPGMPAHVWIEVPHQDDIQPLPTAADARVTWLIRDKDTPITDAVRTATLPKGTPYAWIAGEAGTVRTLRRHLVNDRGIDRKAITFTGYWRRGKTEEQLLDELA
ncbi:siderophore-interacting protein [Streptomyces sp. URMC 126]|uniref:siderophore-interacting protein n=1 Tax=Streptomyces sp. URMC 126 TaxID=3423401 RepID=UPI003F1C5347